MNMLPFQLFALAVYVPIRSGVALVQKKRLNLLRELTVLLLLVSLIGVLSQAVLPKIQWVDGELRFLFIGEHHTNLIPFAVIAKTADELNRGNLSALLINVIGNIAVFVPIGFFPTLLWELKLRQVLLVGFLTSLFIEVTQLFLPRYTDADDLILNTFGAFIGYLLCCGAYKVFPRLQEKIRSK